MHSGTPALSEHRPRPSPAQIEQPSLADEMRHAVLAIVAGWRTIGLCALAAVLATFFYTLLATPLYTAETQLLLEPRQQQIVAGRVVDTSLGSSAIGADLLSLDSQIQVLQSQSIFAKVIAAEGLTQDPEFAGNASPFSGLRAWLEGLLGSDGEAGSPESRAFERVLEVMRRRLDVSRESNTYVITIAFKAEDPQKAARIANRFAEIYLRTNAEAAFASTEEAAQALQERLASLRAEASRDNEAVETYRRENRLTSTENLLVIDQQLRDLNNQLSLARVAKVAAETDLSQVRQARSAPGGAGLGAIALQSTVVSELQVALATLEVEERGLSARYLPNHPALASVLERKAGMQAAIDAEFARVIQRLELAYEIASDREASILAQVDELESRSADLDVASVRLRELEREAASSQTVYETFLNRAKEVTEQVGLPTNQARMISEAFPPSRPSEPRTLVLLLASAVIGSAFGLAAVWLAQVFRSAASRPALFMSHAQVRTAVSAAQGASARQQIVRATGMPQRSGPPQYRTLK